MIPRSSVVPGLGRRMGAVVRGPEPLQLAECFGDNNQCLITPTCRLSQILNSGLIAFINHLDGYTLADLVNAPTCEILRPPAGNSSNIPINPA